MVDRRRTNKEKKITMTKKIKGPIRILFGTKTDIYDVILLTLLIISAYIVIKSSGTRALIESTAESFIVITIVTILTLLITNRAAK